jgi:hypothetical protein
MDNIKDGLNRHVKEQLNHHLEGTYTENSFLNIGVGLITFAYHYQKIFSTYYLSKNVLSQHVKKNMLIFIDKMKTDPILALLDMDRLHTLMDDMWVYTFALATLIFTHEDVQPLEHYIDQLEGAGKRLVFYHLFSSGNIENCLALMANKAKPCK